MPHFAAIQMTSTTDIERNLNEAEFLLIQASQRGVSSLAVLPEMFPSLGDAGI